MAPAELVARPRRSVRLEARSRHELLLCTRAVLRDLAPSWSIGDWAVILIKDPSLGHHEVHAAFDEINERYHVSGVEIEFADDDGEPLRAVFSATTE